MARRVIGAAVAVAAVAAVVVGVSAGGCSGTAQQLPAAKPVETPEPPKPSIELKADERPAKSDPVAADLVASALKAHAGDQQAALQKLRTVRFVREGLTNFGGPQPVPQKWEVLAAWPNRFRVKAEFPPAQVVTLAWTGDAGWRAAPAVGKMDMSVEEVKDFQRDVTGEWLTLLFPLAEPDTVFSIAPDVRLGDKELAGVRVWNANLSPAVVHFDKETKLLAQITYEGRESGKKVTKEIQVTAAKQFFGPVKLPEKYVILSEGRQLADWTVTELAPVDSLDPKLFKNP